MFGFKKKARSVVNKGRELALNRVKEIQKLPPAKRYTYAIALEVSALAEKYLVRALYKGPQYRDTLYVRLGTLVQDFKDIQEPTFKIIDMLNKGELSFTGSCTDFRNPLPETWKIGLPGEEVLEITYGPALAEGPWVVSSKNSWVSKQEAVALWKVMSSLQDLKDKEAGAKERERINNLLDAYRFNRVLGKNKENT